MVAVLLTEQILRSEFIALLEIYQGAPVIILHNSRDSGRLG